MSTDRSTRASVTLALVDTPVNVVIAQNAATAVERLQQEVVDAIVVDARTIGNPSRLVDAIDAKSPETPTFVHWGEDTPDTVDVLAAVVARADETDSMDQLATAVTKRIGIDTDEIGVGKDRPQATTPPSESSADDLDVLVGSIRQRLVDVTSPMTVEQILFEEFTNTDRFTFSWIGEYDHGERELVPWLTDPETMQWPMHQTFSIGTGEYPLVEQVMRTLEVQTTANIGETPGLVPLGTHAIDRGVDAVAVAPLRSEEEFYGVLVVYAPDPITDEEQAAITAIAETASHVLESIAIRGQLDQQAQVLQRYERLVETAGDGMYVLDDRGHIMTVNDALLVMTGYSREGLLGEHVSMLFGHDDVAVSMDTTQRLLEREENTATIELTMETKGGETVPCEVQLAILEQESSLLGSVGVVRDITERKRDERKLKAQNERLDAFTRIVSHDLRNPLGVAQGYLDLAIESGSADHLETVRDGLERMDAIISDVLAIARNGEWVSETEPLDLETVAHEAWTHVDTAAATLSVEETMTIDADRSRFLRLLENCFRNAVEHGGNAVTVRVGSLSPTGKQASTPRGFYIADDGRGFATPVDEQLFDPSVSESGELGIGLWIVNEVATAHGWSVDARASDDGGAWFGFEIDPDTDDSHRRESAVQFEYGVEPTETDEPDTQFEFGLSSDE